MAAGQAAHKANDFAAFFREVAELLSCIRGDQVNGLQLLQNPLLLVEHRVIGLSELRSEFALAETVDQQTQGHSSQNLTLLHPAIGRLLWRFIQKSNAPERGALKLPFALIAMC